MDEGSDVSRDTVMLTYEELATRLGIDVQSARRRVLRHRWAKTKGNDGRPGLPSLRLSCRQPARLSPRRMRRQLPSAYGHRSRLSP